MIKIHLLLLAVSLSILSFARATGSLSDRALFKSPYAPKAVDCESGTQLVRQADSISDREAQYVQDREKVTLPALRSWLENSGLEDFDADSFLQDNKVRVGVAMSGGGYRAMLVGAGMFAALDGRTPGSDQPGHMGGLIQASTYLAGLSGGSWLLSSLVVNNWTTISNIQNDPQLWGLGGALAFLPNSGIVDNARYYLDVSNDVLAKANAGFNVTLVDYWGRALGHLFYKFPDGGVDVKWSDVRNYDAFQKHDMPFPIMLATARDPHTTTLDTNSALVEYSPFEFGSWDPEIASFADTKYIGTTLKDGRVVGSTCVTGFDNVGFLTGISSAIFSRTVWDLQSRNIPAAIMKLLKAAAGFASKTQLDIALVEPNPFSGISSVDSNIADNYNLDMVDGGTDYENIPFVPLTRPEREIDVVIAFDSSQETDSSDPLGQYWPNGTSISRTYERQFGRQKKDGVTFPYIPDSDTLLYGGWTQQPTFYGCNRNNLSSLFPESMPESERQYPPVLVVLPNVDLSYPSNTDAYKMTYNTKEIAGMIENGYNIATQGNGTIHDGWRACVACAVVLRAQQRAGETPTEQCQQCFTDYCWDGTYTQASSSSEIKRHDGRSNKLQ